MLEQMSDHEREVLRDAAIFWIKNNVFLKDQDALKEEFILHLEENLMKYQELRRQVFDFFWREKLS